MEKEKKR
ncbi:hypothetical protein EUTSA_v100183041mg, partial [Eutrema salsugineum]